MYPIFRAPKAQTCKEFEHKVRIQWAIRHELRSVQNYMYSYIVSLKTKQRNEVW